MGFVLGNGLFISEIMADNAGTNAVDIDNDGTANKADEFVEIQNASGGPVSLDGLELWSATGGLLYSFGASDTIEAAGTATIVGEYTGALPADFYEATTNDSVNFLPDGEFSLRETLYLLDTNTGEYVAIAYGDPANPALPTGFPGTTDLGTETIDTSVVNGTSIQRDANGDLTETAPTAGTAGATVAFTPTAAPNDIVDGTGGDDTIVAGSYTDGQGEEVDALDNVAGSNEDVINAGQGSDTVSAGEGDDIVYGGGGSDSIEGNDGSDILYGDTVQSPAAQQSEFLDWTAQGSGGTDISGGFVQNTGSVNVIVDIINDGGLTGAVIDNSLNYAPETNIDTNSSLSLNGAGNGGAGVSDTTTINMEFQTDPESGFGYGVENVQFRINDIDQQSWDDLVTVTAIGVDGLPALVTFSIAGDETLINGNSTIDGAGNDTQASSGGSVLVEIAGPIQSLSIDYDNAGTGGQALWITDVHFDTVLDDIGDGDEIDGGAGSDEIYGQEGQDILTGGTGNDYIIGGDDNDSISGGADDDVIYGDGETSVSANEDFEGGATGWSNNTTNDTEAGYTEVLGLVEGTVSATDVELSKTFQLDPTFDDAVIEFDFHQIDSWDSEDFIIFIDGQAIDTRTFATGNNNPGGTNTVTVGGTDYTITFTPQGPSAEQGFWNSGANWTWDQSFRVRIEMENAPSEFELGFGSTLDQDATDESYAIDNVVIVSTNDTSIDVAEVAAAVEETGDDTIDGGAGNDLIFGQSGSDSILGGDGNDTIWSGVGNDDLSGGTGNDFLGGEEGDDTLFGGDGDDTLDGAEGNDSLFGQAGNDTLYGEDGDDYVDGDAGDDLVMGGAGNDVLIGDEGNDTLLGGTDNDQISVSSGNNSIDGGSGIDQVFAGTGDDLIAGGTDADNLNGGDGDDIIYGGMGPDAAPTSATLDWSNVSLTSGDGTVTVNDGTTDIDITITGNGGISSSFFPEDSYRPGGSVTQANPTLIEFDEPVQDISFLIYGVEENLSIPYDDQITIVALDANGNQVPVTFSGLTHQTVNGNSIEGDGDAGDNIDNQITVNISAPIVSLQIIHEPGPDAPASGGVGIGDLTFSLSDGFVDDEAADNMSGGDGTDTFYAGSFDTVTGGESTDDNDTLVVQDVDYIDYVNGNPEAGTVYFNDGTTMTFSEIENVVVTERDGTVSGTAGDDVIDVGYTGDPDGDVVDGNDQILAGADTNDDLILAGDGNDRVFAGAGDDEVYGGAGDDVLSGDVGSDTLFGDDGNDTIYSGSGNDTVYGGAGNDSIGSSIGSDEVYGGDGDDYMSAGGFAGAGDILDGGADNDTIIGGAGDDTLIGGTGDDSLTVRSTGGTDTITGGEDTDDLDVDTLTFLDDNGPDGVSVTTSGSETGSYTFAGELGSGDFAEIESIEGTQQDDVFDVQGGSDGMTLSGNDGDDVFTGVGSGSTVFGDDGNDTITGNASDGAGVSSIFGGAGDDTIDGADRSDIIDGGSGNDTIEAGEENSQGDDDTIFGGTGNDTITSSETDSGSNDSLYGEDGNDTITVVGGDANLLDGGTGDDTLTSGTGDDTLVGGDDADAIYANGGDTVDGGEGGNDLDVLYVEGVASIDYDLNPENGTVNFNDGSTLTFSNIEDVIITDQDGTISGTAGDDIIDAAYTGDPEGDLVDAGDAILAGAQDDDDLIFAGAGVDVISSGAGDDEVYGQDGNDILTGGIGDDTLDGGSGSDTFNIEDGHGNDTIVGGEDVSETDRLVFSSNLTDGVDVVLNNAEDGTYSYQTGPASGEFSEIELTILTSEDDNFDASAVTGGITTSLGSGDDTALGGAGSDTIFAGAGNDSIDGGAGDDRITGNIGSNTLSGGAGADEIFGGAGSDQIFGGDDADLIFAGEGDIVDGGDGGNDDDTLDLTGSVAVGGSYAITKSTDSDGNGFDGTVTYFDDTGAQTGTLDFTNIENFVPCFTPGTRIATMRGQIAVENILPGDKVLTRDHGFQPVQWVGQKHVDANGLTENEALMPIRIRTGALGNGVPERDMLVSPQHRMLISAHSAEMWFGEAEVLVAAKHLTCLDGVDVADAAEVTYIHIMFARHEVVLSDGTWSESFQPGDLSIAGLDGEARRELFALFPELASADGVAAYEAARLSLKAHEVPLLF